MTFQKSRLLVKLPWTSRILLALMVLNTCHCHSLSTYDDDDESEAPSDEDEEYEDSPEPEVKQRLCPKRFAFYNETSTCEQLLKRGPCGKLQVFYPLWKKSEYGGCGCIFVNDTCGVEKNRMVLPSPYPERKRCYWAFSKGPCQSGEWYILNLKTLKPECQINPCSSEYDSSPIVKKPPSKINLFTFIYKGTCYRTYTKGFCSGYEYIRFEGTNDPHPKCVNSRTKLSCFRGFGPTASMPCEPGLKRIGDSCSPTNAEFAF